FFFFFLFHAVIVPSKESYQSNQDINPVRFFVGVVVVDGSHPTVPDEFIPKTLSSGFKESVEIRPDHNRPPDDVLFGNGAEETRIQRLVPVVTAHKEIILLNFVCIGLFSVNKYFVSLDT